MLVSIGRSRKQTCALYSYAIRSFVAELNVDRPSNIYLCRNKYNNYRVNDVRFYHKSNSTREEEKDIDKKGTKDSEGEEVDESLWEWVPPRERERISDQSIFPEVNYVIPVIEK